jgi:hypothetical protein
LPAGGLALVSDGTTLDGRQRSRLVRLARQRRQAETARRRPR